MFRLCTAGAVTEAVYCMYAVSFSYLTQFSAVSLVYAFSVTAPVTVNFKKCAIMHENVRFSDENSKKSGEGTPSPHPTSSAPTVPRAPTFKLLPMPLIISWSTASRYWKSCRSYVSDVTRDTVVYGGQKMAVYLAPRYIVTEMKLSASELELELELITCSFLNVLSTSESPEVHKHSDF